MCSHADSLILSQPHPVLESHYMCHCVSHFQYVSRSDYVSQASTNQQQPVNSGFDQRRLSSSVGSDFGFGLEIPESDAPVRTVLIDYEYGLPLCGSAYDLANHFIECAADYTLGEDAAMEEVRRGSLIVVVDWLSHSSVGSLINCLTHWLLY